MLKGVLAACVGLLLVAACGSSEQATSSSQPTGHLRIVSLAPHLTELAFAAGAGEQLVGAVAFSDYPAAASSVPRIGDAFNLDYERIAQLSPDLVLAWSGGTPTTTIGHLRAMGLDVRSLQTDSLQDVAERLIELGELSGDAGIARARAAAYRAELRTARRAFHDLAPVRVFYQVSLAPLFTPGGPHFITELIELCGGRNIFSDLRLQAAAVTHEAVLSRSPQLIVVGRQWLASTREHWQRYGIDGPDIVGIDADLVTRPGLRLAQGAQALCVAIDSARRSAAKDTGD